MCKEKPSEKHYLDWSHSTPDLKRHLYTDDGKLRSFVNVYVNDEDMRYLQKEATSLKDGDTISIVPSIAGGSPPLTAAELAKVGSNLTC